MPFNVRLNNTFRFEKSHISFWQLYKAKKAKWRISETTLLTLAAIGGSIGAWAGMRIWHHKTLHKKFKYGIPAIIILQIALAAYLHTII